MDGRREREGSELCIWERERVVIKEGGKGGKEEERGRVMSYVDGRGKGGLAVVLCWL